MADIADRRWVQDRLDAGATVTALAADAKVSRQTVYTWLSRHGLTPNSPVKPRPEPDVLAALYATHRSARLVAEQLGVSRDTAQRWLHAAGVTLDVSVEVDVEDARRRRGEGATLQQIAAEQGVAAETIRRRIDE